MGRGNYQSHPFDMFLFWAKWLILLPKANMSFFPALWMTYFVSPPLIWCIKDTTSIMFFPPMESPSVILAGDVICCLPWCLNHRSTFKTVKQKHLEYIQMSVVLPHVIRGIKTKTARECHYIRIWELSQESRTLTILNTLVRMWNIRGILVSCLWELEMVLSLWRTV